jgi:hypothetical protein
MQRSDYPTDLFDVLAAIDPLFLSQGEDVGIVVTIVAASRNLSNREPASAPSPARLPRVGLVRKPIAGS